MMVRLSPMEWADLKEKARIQGCNPSVLMRAALAAYVPGVERSTGNAIRNSESEDRQP